MDQQRSADAEWVVVRRPGIVRLAGAAIRARGAVTQARHRGDTMIALAETLAASRMGAEICSLDPDGARWSMKITAEDAAR
ncbi:hypothetical protein [Amycolatopsis sp. WGS_07]|uniref:hypothetical protein n=1 Tax=Amycolatopsis sp. WGS_07 TaxID=3076764 RepID=UPI003872BADB